MRGIGASRMHDREGPNPQDSVRWTSLKAQDLETVRDQQYIYLTTLGRRTGKTHTVELWFAIANGGIYLSHEGGATDWMRNIQARPRVWARVGSLKFEAEGRVGLRGEEREVGKKALYEKYYGKASREVIDDWFSLSEITLLRPT